MTVMAPRPTSPRPAARVYVVPVVRELPPAPGPASGSVDTW